MSSWTRLLHHASVGLRFAGLEQVFDPALINEDPLPTGAHLDRTAIIPLYHAMELFTVLEHDRHLSLLLDLFLEVERFCMRARLRLRLSHEPTRKWVNPVRGIAATLPGGKPRSYQLAWPAKQLRIVASLVGSGQRNSNRKGKGNLGRR